MLADESLRAGRLEEALAALQDQVRKAPNNQQYRVFLFQLLSVLGQWDRALMQLKVAADLDPQNSVMMQTYREALKCEVLRSQVFRGQKSPLIFGKPEGWVAFLVEALRLDAEGKFEQAKQLRDRAFDQAEPTSGTIDDQKFAWLADGDTRLGPMIEVILNGRYYWMPLRRLRSIKMEKPTDLRDMVWTAATLLLSTGAETVAFIPTRYAGSEAHEDGKIRMARSTDWIDRGGNLFGVGQRIWYTDVGEHPMLDARNIVLDTEVEAAEPEPPASSAEPPHG
jgi:type VI secretion system protein ImpE